MPGNAAGSLGLLARMGWQLLLCSARNYSPAGGCQARTSSALTVTQSIAPHVALCRLAGDRDEVTLYRPARTARMSGKQLTSNAPAVRGSPLNALSVWRYEPRHGAEHRPALLKQVLLDLEWICVKHCLPAGL